VRNATHSATATATGYSYPKHCHGHATPRRAYQVAAAENMGLTLQLCTVRLLCTGCATGEHPQSPRGPFWATPQSLKNWDFGDYEDRHAPIGSITGGVSAGLNSV
jgi:hypothetical protein